MPRQNHVLVRDVVLVGYGNLDRLRFLITCT